MNTGKGFPRSRANVVLVKPADGHTYADVLKNLKENVKPEDADVIVRTIRKTRNGAIFLELAQGGKTKQFSDAIKDTLKETAQETDSKPKAAIEIRDIDCTTTKEDVIVAILKNTGTNEEDMTIGIDKQRQVDPDSPSAYRPLCMLDTARKLLERLLKPRLEKAIADRRGLSNRHHGFRPGRSTVGALLVGYADDIAAVISARDTVEAERKLSCNKAMPKATSRPKRKEVYWWNTTIDESRRNCLKMRRKYTRARRRGDAHIELASYKDAKQQLQNAIETSKKQKWEELRSGKNQDPWGLGYKVVIQKLGSKNTVAQMDEDIMDNILVLLSKGKGETTEPSSYRPHCILDTAGKLLERLIKPRLNEAIKAAGGLSRRQYGFRPGKSTVGALKDVIDTVESAQCGNHYSRPIILLATLDYLRKIIRDYLRNRKLMYDTKQGNKCIQVTSGAAQGSILGPDLWNATYDEILKIEMPHDTYLVGYAGDIAAVIKARSISEAQSKLRQTMIRAKSWLDEHGLQLALQKTELLLLIRRHIPTEIELNVDDIRIPTKQSVKYLGMRLDSKLTYTKQIEYATNKAAEITSQLSRLMPNTGGPLPNSRKILMEASNSILLYGSEIWAPALRTQVRASKLLSVQRTSALRVTSADRTVSVGAVRAGMIPIDLQATNTTKRDRTRCKLKHYNKNAGK
ncbi:uncharacterized protein [Musca autumnalis]|uniref:uncharacterized protein n=1 Tax=Musca autumnalis TaxID=221902 RepID=UPI003CF0F18F